MALGAREVHEAAVGEQVDAAAVGHHELLDERAHLALGDRHLAQLRDVDLDVEVAGVADDGAVLHDLERAGVDDVDVAGDGDPDVADLGGLDRTASRGSRP